MKHHFRSFVAGLMAVIIMVTIIPITEVSSFALTATWKNDWTTWSQGGSGAEYLSTKNDGTYAMRRFGCHMIAHSKLLAEAGIVSASSFNPDIYLDWMLANNYLYGKQSNGTVAVGERSIGAGLIAYAKEKGATISRVATISLSGRSADEKKATVQYYINKGYYVILDYAAGEESHETYIMREKSLQAGTPWISDSSSNYSSVSTKSGIYAYTGSQGGGGKWEKAFQTAYVYSVKSAGTLCSLTYNANGGNETPPSQTVSPGQEVTISSDSPTVSVTRTYNAAGGTVEGETSKIVTYTFHVTGWKVKGGDETIYHGGDKLTLTSDTELVAQWEKLKVGDMPVFLKVGTTKMTKR